MDERLFFEQHLTQNTSLSQEALDFIYSQVQVKTLKKKYFLIQAGELVRYDFFVARGLLRAFHIDRKGKEHILQFALENWWISDYKAYFEERKATLYIETLEDVVVLAFSFPARQLICEKIPAMTSFWLQKSNRGYATLQNRILSLLQDDAQDRYDTFVKQYPLLLPRISGQMLASYLGISRETLSRLKKGA